MKDVNAIRKCLKQRILQNSELFGLEKERSQLYDLFQRTVEHGESNSQLLIGPRGVGKTTLVNDVLAHLQTTKTFRSDCILIKLQGLVHTDDNLALKSITFQMNLDNAVDGEVFGSFAENLAFLLACLRTGEKRTSKSVIFILEEFDLFCAHHNQTLLYNLFDVSQSAQAPICVLGITCRFDVIELLEKRVKSRFSHRQMFIYSGQDEAEDETNLDHALNRVRYYLEIPEKTPFKINPAIRKQWNEDINHLISQKKFKGTIQKLIDINLQEDILKNILIKCIFDLNESNAHLTLEQFQREVDFLETDDMVETLQDLNVLELCLIIAMKHHCEIYDNQPMNFEMIYSRYMKFANKHAGIQSVPKPVVMKAFEHLENIEFIAMINSVASRTQKEYRFFRLLVTSQQIAEAIKKSFGLPTEVIQWANSSLV